MGNTQPTSSDAKDRKSRTNPPPPPPLKSGQSLYIKMANEYRVWSSAKEKERPRGYLFSSIMARERQHCKTLPPNTSTPTRITICKRLSSSSSCPRGPHRKKKLFTVSVAVPSGVSPGQFFMARLPNGKQMRIKVPNGASPGTVLKVNYNDDNAATKTNAPASSSSSSSLFSSRLLSFPCTVF
mmetsp:Transcript_13650/g.22863  ORF Transcript_13650/g.22863 Transcript_13650/m.22863 type:complete len:183 (-) Transcript_13650:1485-2033(-)